MKLDVDEIQSSSIGFIPDIPPSTPGRRFYFQDVGETMGSEKVPSLLSSSSPSKPDLVPALVNRYVSGGISIGRAAEIIGLCYDDFIKKVVEKGLRLPMGPATLQEFKEEDRILQSYLSSSVAK
ncbi:MAG: hypothetical protein ACHQ03_01620 [Candidatus Bathyarchaeia archaeon]